MPSSTRPQTAKTMLNPLQRPVSALPNPKLLLDETYRNSQIDEEEMVYQEKVAKRPGTGNLVTQVIMPIIARCRGKGQLPGPRLGL